MKCPKCQSNRIIKKGKIKTRKNGKKVQRFQCKICQVLFTNRNFLNEYREKKPELASAIKQLYLEGMTFRGIARYLKCDYKTVVRKFEKHSQIAQRENNTENLLNRGKLKIIQMGELATYIQSKAHPIYISLAVSGNGKILSCKSCENKKKALNDSLTDIINYVSNETIFYFKSEKYIPFIENHFPHTDYVTCSGRNSDSYLQHLNFTRLLIKNRLARMSQNSWSFNRKAGNLQLSLELLKFSFNQKFKQHAKIIKIAKWIKEPFETLNKQLSEIKKAG